MAYGVANETGEDVIRPKYQELIENGDKYYIAKKNNKYGIIDTEENVIVPFEYDNAFLVRLRDNFLLMQDSKVYIVDMNGKELNKDGFALFAYNIGTQVKTGKNIKRQEDVYPQSEDYEITLEDLGKDN